MRTARRASMWSISNVIATSPEAATSPRRQQHAMVAHVIKEMFTGVHSRQSALAVFHKMDQNQSGSLDARELQIALHRLVGVEIDLPRIQLVLQAMDIDGDGRVSADDFLYGHKMARLAIVRQGFRACSYQGGRQDWAKLFRRYDRDNSGFIDFGEFQKSVRRDARLTANMVSEAELQDLFDFIDQSNTGAITADDFVGLLEDQTLARQTERGDHTGDSKVVEMTLKAIAEQLDKTKATAHHMFREADADNSGQLTAQEFELILAKRMKLTLSRPEIEELISAFDTAGSGTVSSSEFIKRVRKVQRDQSWKHTDTTVRPTDVQRSDSSRAASLTQARAAANSTRRSREEETAKAAARTSARAAAKDKQASKMSTKSTGKVQRTLRLEEEELEFASMLAESEGQAAARVQQVEHLKRILMGEDHAAGSGGVMAPLPPAAVTAAAEVDKMMAAGDGGADVASKLLEWEWKVPATSDEQELREALDLPAQEVWTADGGREQSALLREMAQQALEMESDQLSSGGVPGYSRMGGAGASSAARELERAATVNAEMMAQRSLITSKIQELKQEWIRRPEPEPEPEREPEPELASAAVASVVGDANDAMRVQLLEMRQQLREAELKRKEAEQRARDLAADKATEADNQGLQEAEAAVAKAQAQAEAEGAKARAVEAEAEKMRLAHEAEKMWMAEAAAAKEAAKLEEIAIREEATRLLAAEQAQERALREEATAAVLREEQHQAELAMQQQTADWQGKLETLQRKRKPPPPSSAPMTQAAQTAVAPEEDEVTAKLRRLKESRQKQPEPAPATVQQLPPPTTQPTQAERALAVLRGKPTPVVSAPEPADDLDGTDADWLALATSPEVQAKEEELLRLEEMRKEVEAMLAGAGAEARESLEVMLAEISTGIEDAEDELLTLLEPEPVSDAVANANAALAAAAEEAEAERMWRAEEAAAEEAAVRYVAAEAVAAAANVAASSVQDVPSAGMYGWDTTYDGRNDALDTYEHKQSLLQLEFKGVSERIVMITGLVTV